MLLFRYDVMTLVRGCYAVILLCRVVVVAMLCGWFVVM